MAEITDPDVLKQFSATSSAPSGLVTDPEILKQFGVEPPASTAADVAKSGGIGLAKGAIAGVGAAGDVRGLASAATDYLGKKIGASPEGVQTFKDYAEKAARMTPFGSVLSSAPSSSDIQNRVEGVTGEFYKPKTTAGKYAETTGEFLGNPATYLGPGGVLAKGATAIGAGLGSEAAGQLAKGSKYEPLIRVIGGVAGGHLITGAPRIVTPNIIAPERQAMLNVLQGEGVDSLTAGQRTGNKGLKWAESTLADVPFSGTSAEAINEAGSGQFTRAALRRVGENAERASPEVIDRAFNRIGGTFDRLTGRNTMRLDPQVQNDMLNTTLEYHNNVAPMMRSPFIENMMNDAAQWAGQQGGQLSGVQYQNLRSRLSAAARGSNDPQLSHALSDMTEHLDDAMERSIAASNPHDAGAFADARRQYRNMLVVERAATGAGEAANQGFISPAQLSGAAKAVIGRRAYARGQGDFADLARAGESIMKPLPQSGTAPRENILHLLQLAGLLGGEHVGGIPGALGAAVAGIAVPAGAARALMSRPVQGYIANQALPYRLGTAPTMQALVNAIRGGQTPQIPAPSGQK